ncbi:hypothetical protein KPH14_002857 [Odynerus spinipes]|uniref:Uncharacterized protein n=1 Tax=Odynerus spinipes TaxID=1348599 RepID=A0AAD9VU45_9HYME|nr:hypothetical protein KPH14_002857 [Odynerus spinipes]
MEEVNSGSRTVLRDSKDSYEIESSEESCKSEEERFSRNSERGLRRAKIEIEETIETERIHSRTLNDTRRSSTGTSRDGRERSTRSKGKHRHTETPITETLRKALDKRHMDHYEESVTPSTLTTDKIYIQGKNGFSAVRIAIASDEDERCASKSLSKDVDILRQRTTLAAKGISSPIVIAIVAQKCWKRTAIVYQGLLAGMALLHFTMIRVFFDASMEFISRYSILSEIYSGLFSLLIALSVISIFDKFDIAHLKMNRLHNIRGDYIGSAIAIPLYVATLCLHETFANLDDRLALIHYRDFNGGLSNSNNTNMEDFLNGLTIWQEINISKDLLATLAWFLVAVGTQDDALLMHLESMQE